ncbi:unnamed protein product [Amoebophrya sp. A120]|nr:unnamed protein product [Amoebophrya sp. A120]|eukprot:GSA120T00023163001.1
MSVLPPRGRNKICVLAVFALLSHGVVFFLALAAKTTRKNKRRTPPQQPPPEMIPPELAAGVGPPPPHLTGAPAGSSKDGTEMFRCDACQISLTRLRDDVQYLIQKERAWKKQDLLKRLDMMCQDPAMNEQYAQQQCRSFLSDRKSQIASLVRERQDPDKDAFEDNFPDVKKLCLDWHECVPGQKTLNEILSEMPAPGEEKAAHDPAKVGADEL